MRFPRIATFDIVRALLCLLPPRCARNNLTHGEPLAASQVFRSIPLPPNADMDSLTGASYKNGVLHMHVHKKAGASLEGHRKIELLK